jgi:hypothetical protein
MLCLMVVHQMRIRSPVHVMSKVQNVDSEVISLSNSAKSYESYHINSSDNIVPVVKMLQNLGALVSNISLCIFA